MERELVMSGIGGQGVQLASAVLAQAAVAQGLEVQVFGSYGGMMRGGATEATVVLADVSVEAPPTIGASWSVVLMHDEHSAHARSCLRPGSLLFVNADIVAAPDRKGALSEVVVVEVPALTLARDVGHPMGESLVMLGAYAVATGLVAPASLTAAVGDALPPYRSQHREACTRSIEAGAASVAQPVAVAWPEAARR
ncbi:MAG: 2-oxoacid:acceptor oxidoreductase family protein [Acidimicrobiales bacterium]|nr:2-oxoacid:acceptor oxidoreductase family protein [Acidimicrobiales bacterium]